MMFRVEAWTVPLPDDEESCELEMHDSEEFSTKGAATAWAWARMEEGFMTQMFRI